jgi:hypothetical protein
VAQRWRWDGRPVYENLDQPGKPPRSGLPFRAIGNIEETLQDAALFSSRADSDAGVHPGQLEFLASDKPELPLYKFSWTGKRGVLYYRLALRSFSRYEGALSKGAMIESDLPATERAPRRWRRYVKRCTWTDVVPKPLVKLVVPLTQTAASFEGQPKTPGWLVVLDEPWYGEAMAGLGEVLESRIAEVRLPESGDLRQQIGPDGVLEMPDDPLADWDVQLPRPVGAAGQTLDTDPVAPLFAHAAYLQPPPVLTPLPNPDHAAPPPPDLSFYFVKLEFRRSIAGVDPEYPQALALSSRYTDPVWVQILPPSTFWRIQKGNEVMTVDVTGLHFVSGKGLTFGGEEVNVLPTGPYPPIRSSISSIKVWVLVTRRVFDAFGRTDQEAYHKLMPPSDLRSLPDSAALRLRFLEIQYRGSASDELDLEKLTNLLFGKRVEAPEDALARMVRASPAFI